MQSYKIDGLYNPVDGFFSHSVTSLLFSLQYESVMNGYVESARQALCKLRAGNNRDAFSVNNLHQLIRIADFDGQLIKRVETFARSSNTGVFAAQEKARHWTGFVVEANE